MRTKLPALTQQPVINVAATPDADYPLRILRAYRQNCDSMWASNSDGSVNSPLLEMMNEDNRKRAAILDKAIRTLEEAR